jgi:hypothetical protein
MKKSVHPIIAAAMIIKTALKSVPLMVFPPFSSLNCQMKEYSIE